MTPICLVRPLVLLFQLLVKLLYLMTIFLAITPRRKNPKNTQEEHSKRTGDYYLTHSVPNIVLKTISKTKTSQTRAAN